MTTKRYTISQPADWIEAAKHQAAKEGKTLSEWIGDAMLAKLPAKIRKGLGERPAAGRRWDSQDSA